jgi:hypothetical protein
VLAYEGRLKEERDDDAFVESLISGVGASKLITPQIVRDWYDELVEDKEYLMAVLTAGFDRVRGEGVPKVGHSKLRLAGLGTKEIVFVPSGAAVDQERIHEIMGKKHWNIKLPNMCTKFDFGNCHPAALATPKLCASEQFVEIAEAAEIMGRDPAMEMDVRCLDCGVLAN